MLRLAPTGLSAPQFGKITLYDKLKANPSLINDPIHRSAIEFDTTMTLASDSQTHPLSGTFSHSPTLSDNRPHHLLGCF